MDQSSQHSTSRDPSTTAVGHEWHGTLLLETLVRASFVVVRDKRGEDAEQVALVQDH
jgi:hypothetical protein